MAGQDSPQPNDNSLESERDRWAQMDPVDLNHEARRVIGEDKVSADVLRDLLREFEG